MILPHYLRDLKKPRGVYLQHHPTPSHITDATLEKSWTLKGSKIALLSASVIRLTDK